MDGEAQREAQARGVYAHIQDIVLMELYGGYDQLDYVPRDHVARSVLCLEARGAAMKKKMPNGGGGSGGSGVNSGGKGTTTAAGGAGIGRKKRPVGV